MLTIACINAGDYLGRGAEYVRLLRDGISAWLTVPHRFVCFTDCQPPTPGVICEDLPYPGLNGWWNKLALFKPGVFDEGERVVFIDLDTVITGPLDWIAEYGGAFAMLAPFYPDEMLNPVFRGPQSGFMAWQGGFGAHIWQAYEAMGYPDLPGGDMAFINRTNQAHGMAPDLLQVAFPGRIASFKATGGMVPAADCSVTCFHGEPRPHQVDTGWVPASARANAVLARLPRNGQPVSGAEIGVFTGLMSRQLLKRPGLHLTMVDSWEGDGAAYAEGATDWNAGLGQAEQDHAFGAAHKMTELAMDRREIRRQRSLDATAEMPDGHFDFVFLDADHTYESIRADIAAWAPKVKPGGLLCGHDYDNPRFPEWGVSRAAHEYADANGLLLDAGENYTWFVKLPNDGSHIL